MDKVLVVENLYKSFKQGDNVICVLDGASFSLKHGEVVALVGSSGCGKTTFLHLVGLLDESDSGTIRINGNEYSAASDYARTTCRQKHLGFVYQSHNLLSDFTALENVALPLRLGGTGKKEAYVQAEQLLVTLQLKDRLHHFPAQLSGGEQQRVAIARSLVHNPSIILADEPTGNLDSKNSQIVLELLIETVRDLGKSLVIVTHNQSIASKADRVVTIKQGKLIGGGVTSKR